MSFVRTNNLKNRLYITLKDWDPVNRSAYVQDIESACRDLVFGFSCLIVLTKNGLVRQIDKDLLFCTTDLISAYGAAKVVVVRKPSATMRIFRESPFSVHSFFPIEQASSIKEAESILDN